jgi:hypothetical protein
MVMSYTIIKKFNAHCIHIKFDGLFQGKTVTWNTHFFTLQGYIDQKNIKNKELKQFIDIQPIETGVMKLEIALNISEINNPSIQKMMIMIKQYKNLSIGRHEYG